MRMKMAMASIRMQTLTIKVLMTSSILSSFVSPSYAARSLSASAFLSGVEGRTISATTSATFQQHRRHEQSLLLSNRFHHSCASSSLPVSCTSSLLANSHRRSMGTLSMISGDSGEGEKQLIQDMLARIRSINRMPDEIRSTLLDFEVDGQKLGKVRPSMAEKLCSIPHHSLDDDMDHDGGSLFVLRSDDLQRQYLTLSTKIAGRTVESRTKAVATVMAKLRKDGVITGWRDEQFQVSATYYSDPLFLIERSATNILGVLDYGVHINGLVRQQTSPEAPPKMWIGRRSATKSKFPGMLDHLVAGGQPANLGLMENCLKECEEEAGVPPELVKAGIHPVGAISYQNWDPRSDKISRVVLFNYDLYLPESFKPKPVDGEVEEFVLWDIDQVKASMALDYPDPIKPNCYVVIIDYLLRQGYINPEVEGYLDILRELRSGECQ